MRLSDIYVGNLTIIVSDNGLSPGRRQAIIWTNVGVLLIGPVGTYFNDILIEICTFSLKNIHFKMPSGKWQPFFLRLNVLTDYNVPELGPSPSGTYKFNKKFHPNSGTL